MVAKDWKIEDGGLRHASDKAIRKLEAVRSKNKKYWTGVNTIFSRAFASEHEYFLTLPDHVTLSTHAFLQDNYLKEITLPKNLTRIPSGAFSQCLNLEKVVLPKNLAGIASTAFANCTGLSTINLPENLKQLELGCFYNCSSLKKINLPINLTHLGQSAFEKCSNLQMVKLPDGISKLAANTFANCTGLKAFDCNEKLKVIGDSCFLGCENLQSVNLPKSVKLIEANAFKDCKNLEYFEINSDDIVLKKNAINADAFNYINLLKDNRLLLSKELPPEDKTNNSFDLKKLQDAFLDFDISFVITNKTDISRLDQLAAKLQESKAQLPFNFASHLICDDEIFNNFLHNANLKEYKVLTKNVNKFVLEDCKKTRNYASLNLDMSNLTIFAHSLGAFEKHPLVRQRACSFLLTRILGRDLPADELNKHDLKISDYNPDFAYYIFKNDNFKKLLICLKKQPNIVSEVHNNFKEITKTFVTSPKVGVPKKLEPTTELFLKHFNKLAPDNHAHDDIFVANEVLKFVNNSEDHLNKGLNILGEFNDACVSANILKTYLIDKKAKEKLAAFDDKADFLQNETITKVNGTYAKFVQDKNDSGYFYEWLEKDNPSNLILGQYCNCCAHLTGMGYGVMRASVIDPNMQNLVVRNDENEIVGKSTLFINKEQGYGVFNNFSVNTNIERKERKKILNSFVDGVNDFALNYNNENPKSPLRKINVGMSFNDLSEELKEMNFRPAPVLKGANFEEYVDNGITYSDGTTYKGNWMESQYRIWNEKTKDHEQAM